MATSFNFLHKHGRDNMGIINLIDAKVSYEGQTLPAINLLSKLQMQLRDAACRIATIAETLGDLQTALLNSHTVEVKLTLSKEDYSRFKSMEGMDDNERIRKVIMNVIHPEESGVSEKAGESKPAVTAVESRAVPLPVESAPVIPKSAERLNPPLPELQPVEKTPPGDPVTREPEINKKPTTRCPTCHALIELPGTLNDEWPVELKCGTCGAKCLLKPLFRK
jgi:DNA-directed RNA polymerase subunit RPC12/RpoP